MSVTTVPLRPVSKRALVLLWIGIALAVALAAAGAWAGTQAMVGAKDGDNDQFLAWNARQKNVEQTESGLQYQVLKEGTGEQPTAADVALVNYKGALRDGKVFDQNERTPMPVGEVIPGFSEGLKLMNRGASYRFWIPPAIGYGDKDVGGGAIPADSVLVFDVELLDFIPAAVLQQMQMQQQGVPGGMPPGGVGPGGR